MKLTINEVALALNLPLNTLVRWIRQGRIPIQKSGHNYIFNESVLEKWAINHNLPFSLPEIKECTNPDEQNPEKLLQVMQRGGVIYDITGNDVKTVLKSAIDKIAVFQKDDQNKVFKLLMERENLTSTGIGKGVAIPHPHDPLNDILDSPLISTCFLKKPVDFGAIDDMPVFIMFILLSQSVKIHLHLLSRLSFCLRDNSFINFLKTIPDSTALFSKIAEFENRLDCGDHY